MVTLCQREYPVHLSYLSEWEKLLPWWISVHAYTSVYHLFAWSMNLLSQSSWWRGLPWGVPKLATCQHANHQLTLWSGWTMASCSCLNWHTLAKTSSQLALENTWTCAICGFYLVVLVSRTESKPKPLHILCASHLGGVPISNHFNDSRTGQFLWLYHLPSCGVITFHGTPQNHHLNEWQRFEQYKPVEFRDGVPWIWKVSNMEISGVWGCFLWYV